jgi:dihydroxy-acid dehydratase
VTARFRRDATQVALLSQPPIDIDIAARRIELLVDDAELARRRAQRDELGWAPLKRDNPSPRRRAGTPRLAQSADKGAVRHVPEPA